jgi:hypothetical protein
VIKRTPWSIGKGFVSCRVIVDAGKSCCHADNEWSNERTKAMSSYVDVVGLKVFSSVELSRTLSKKGSAIVTKVVP